MRGTKRNCMGVRKAVISHRGVLFTLERNQPRGQLDNRSPASMVMTHYISAVSATGSGVCYDSPGNRCTHQQLTLHIRSLTLIRFSWGPSLMPCRGHSRNRSCGQLPYGAERCWALGSWFSSEGWEHAPITAHFVLGTV